MARRKAKTKKTKRKTKKKTDVKSRPEPVAEDADNETKAKAFDEIVEKNNQVQKLKNDYLIAKDKSLGCKKKYDEANGELQDLIVNLSRPLPLFEDDKTQEEPENSEDTEDIDMPADPEDEDFLDTSEQEIEDETDEDDFL